MNRYYKIAFFLIVIGSMLFSCRTNEDPTIQEPVTLLSKLKTQNQDAVFTYNQAGKLTALSIIIYGSEKYRFTFSYSTDGKLTQINSEIIGAQKGSYKFTWSSPTEANIEGVSLYDGKINTQLTTDLSGKPLELKRISGLGGMFGGHYVYKYDNKGNRTEIISKDIASEQGKVSVTTKYDDKKSPFGQNYQVLTLLDSFEHIGWSFFYTQPFGASNNSLDQSRGKYYSWVYTYRYNSLDYPIELEAQYTDTRVIPYNTSKAIYTFEYITQ